MKAILALAAIIPVAVLGATAQHSTVYYVATDGNDAWSGKVREPNAAGTDGPFATVHRARDAVWQLKTSHGLQDPVKVLLRGGTHHLSEVLRLGPEHSGTGKCPITYTSPAGEKAVLSGGRLLRKWRAHHGKIMCCALGGLRFRQLFYRGERQILARWPNRDPQRPRTGGFLYVPQVRGSRRDVYYGPGPFPREWAKPKEAQVVIFAGTGWFNPQVPIAEIDEGQHLIRLARAVHPQRTGNRYYFQNALEELDTPGEWYLDRQSDTVYFWPPDDQLTDHGALAPALDNIVRFEGDFGKGEPVEQVRLMHIGLECSRGHGVVLRAARHCGVIGCNISQVGHTGVVFDAGTSHCRVAGNDIPHPGAHAIAMYYRVGTPDACRDNVIANNYAHHCGDVSVCSFGWGSGICISGHRNVVSHNLVHDTAYSAINFDGYDHVIEYNHVHHACLECYDGDGIYGWVNTKAGSGGSAVRFNRVHDVVGYGMVRPGVWKSPHHSLGIRCDDYLSHTTIHGNLVYRCGNACICLHGGWNNTVENNILVDGAQSQVRLANMQRHDPKPHRKHLGRKAPGTGKWTLSGHVVRRNVMCYSGPDAAAYGNYAAWEDRILAEADSNLFWAMGRGPRVSIVGWPLGRSWERWLAGGRDGSSLVADPLFVDPGNDDYRLRPESPAFKLGFKPLPVEQMGLVNNAERASWPVVEPEVVRDAPPPPPPPPPRFDVHMGRAYRRRAPLAIDGKLDQEEWGATIASRGLIIERLPDGQISPRKARVAAQWDDSNLYVAVTGPSFEMAQIELTLWPTVYGEPDGPVSIMRVDNRGEVERLTATRGGAEAAECAMRAADVGWTCEWQVPFAACGIEVHRAAALRFNVRIRHGGVPWVAWVTASGAEGGRPAAGHLLFRPAIPANSHNLLINGDFEAGQGAPDGWQKAERITGQLPDAARKPRCLWVPEGRRGSRCLKLAAPDEEAMPACECWWHQTIQEPKPGLYVMSYEARALDVIPRGDNARFYACGWARMKEGAHPSGMNLGYSPENRIDRGSAPLWTRRECLLNVPPNVQTLHLIFGIKQATGTVWVDSVRLDRGQ